MNYQNEATKLANEHWDYVAKLLANVGMDEKCIKIAGFHYKTAFIHGFKHGVEWASQYFEESK
jgi:hypothetical protein